MAKLNPDYVLSLPHRYKDTHKGACGKLIVVAGSDTMMGAAVLLLRAALRSGVGVVYIAAPSIFTSQIMLHIPEVMAIPLDFKYNLVRQLEKIMEIHNRVGFDAMAVGPGLGQDENVIGGLRKLISMAGKRNIPMVIDADGLRAVSVDSLITSISSGTCVLTPHVKEFEALFNMLPITNEERRDAVQNASHGTKQVVLLKGPDTVIGYGGDYVINPSGNEGLATAGSGDVLTGIIGALLAQGLDSFKAGYLGAYLHGISGDICKSKKGVRSMIASDIVLELPAAFQVCATGHISDR